VPVKNAPIEKAAPKAVQDTSKITGDERISSSSEPTQATSPLGDEPVNAQASGTASEANEWKNTGDEPAAVINTTDASSSAAKDSAKSQAPPKSTGDIA
jgi:hypothetical protein